MEGGPAEPPGYYKERRRPVEVRFVGKPLTPGNPSVDPRSRSKEDGWLVADIVSIHWMAVPAWFSIGPVVLLVYVFPRSRSTFRLASRPAAASNCTLVDCGRKDSACGGLRKGLGRSSPQTSHRGRRTSSRSGHFAASGVGGGGGVPGPGGQHRGGALHGGAARGVEARGWERREPPGDGLRGHAGPAAEFSGFALK